jgi:hypothetical protein
MISISHWGMFEFPYVPGPEEIEWRRKSGPSPWPNKKARDAFLSDWWNSC